jgi:hypothetical protein
VRDLRDKIYEELCRICDELEADLRNEESEEFDSENRVLPELVNNHRVQAWLKKEPNFAKRIATPIHGKQPRDKLTLYLVGGVRRGGVILRGTNVTQANALDS